MSETPNGEEWKEITRNNDYFPAGNFPQPNIIVPPQYFTQHMYYPYVNPYSHLTEPGGSLSVHGYGSDGRPKFRRSRTIFTPEQLEILEQHFDKYKYPDVKRRRVIADEVGLADERVQVWFQNRRAKSKRQTDQQVKLQKLVDEAINTSTGNELQRIERTGDENKSSTDYRQGLFGQPSGQSQSLENVECENFLRSTERLSETRNLRQNCNPANRDSLLENEDVTFPRQVDGCSAENQQLWPQTSISNNSGPNFNAAATSDTQVVIQNIDQDLLFKVANILSASNDASSLIAEWSQSPNKTQTSNLEEQLRHFAEHHQQVLGDNTKSTTQNESSNIPAQDI